VVVNECSVTLGGGRKVESKMEEFKDWELTPDFPPHRWYCAGAAGHQIFVSPTAASPKGALRLYSGEKF